MAHKLKVEVVPHINKDGSESKTKKDYTLIDRTRGRQVFRGTFSSQKALDTAVEQNRADFITEHLAKHPNDLAFRRKHGISA